jgi:acyl carrier protein
VTEIMPRPEFYRRAVALIAAVRGASEDVIPDAEEVGDSSRSIWDLGFDSALLVEFVVNLESENLVFPESTPWNRLTMPDLYEAYLAGVLARTSPDQ